MITVTLTIHTQSTSPLLYNYLKKKYAKKISVERAGVSMTLQFKRWRQVECLEGRIRDHIETCDTVELTSSTKIALKQPKEKTRLARV